MSFPTRKIGNTEVSAIGFGAMGLSSFYGKPLPDEERLVLLDAVYESGSRFWDTSDTYHDNEDLIGKWFQRSGKRSDIFLATKFGFLGASDPKAGLALCGTPEYAKQALERSLKRLGTDYIDLWYLHRPDPKVPIEITVGAMAEAVKAGKVKHIGLSECSVDTLRRAHAIHPISALEVEYSAITLDIEDEKIGLYEACKELGIAIVAYSPLGRGALTGQYTSSDQFQEGDIRRMMPRYQKENFPNILKLVEALKEIAGRYNATAGQVALAWSLGQSDLIIPIPGTTRVTALKENLGAINIKLTPAELQEVRDAAEVAGAGKVIRVPEAFKWMMYMDTPPLPK